MINGMDPILKYSPLWSSWEIDSFIGEGSYGRVYKAVRRDVGGTYESAVKLISIPKSDAEIRDAENMGMDSASLYRHFDSATAKILREIKIMRELRGNSNIVAYEDHQIIHTPDTLHWDILIRMELLEVLRSYAARNGLSVQDVCRLGTDICSALSVCENRNIIHRDVKDGNIFVSGDGVFKLGDFGIARDMSDNAMSTMTMRGTPAYLAPEIYRHERYDQTVDIYSLGILLYKYLNCGRYPFYPLPPNPVTMEDNERAVMRRFSGEKLPPPANGGRKLQAAVLKACAYRPEDRYQTAEQFQTALRSAGASAPETQLVPARRAGKTQRIERSANRTPAAGDDEVTVSIQEQARQRTAPEAEREHQAEAQAEREVLRRFAEEKAALEARRDVEREEAQRRIAEQKRKLAAERAEVQERIAEQQRRQLAEGMAQEPRGDGDDRTAGKRILLVAVTAALAIIAAVFLLTKKRSAGEPAAKMETTMHATMDATMDATLPTASPLPPIERDPLIRPCQNIIAAGEDFTVAICSDGSVMTIGSVEGYSFDTGSWTDIVQLAADDNHAVGLRSNGTLVVTGANVQGECNVTGWQDVKQVDCGYQHTIAVTTNGRVLYTGLDLHKRSSCTKWTDVKEVLAGSDHVAAIKEDGSVVAVGWNKGGQCNTKSLRNVIDGDVKSCTTFCILDDHSVVALGTNFVGEDNVDTWHNIVAVSGGDEHTVGLMDDGRVVATGSNQYGQCDVSQWTDIVAVAAGKFHTVGVCSDGTLVATGLNDCGQCNVNGISVFN